MARKVTAKNIVGLAFIAPVIVLIAFMAILSYAIMQENTNIGDALLSLFLSFLGAPVIILTILSIVFTLKGGKLKWLWSIPLGVISTSIALSVILVNNQVEVHKSKCESYASWSATIEYLKDRDDSRLILTTGQIENPGPQLYDIMVEANLPLEISRFTGLSHHNWIKWYCDDCSLTFYSTDIVCSRIITTKNWTNTYTMRYSTSYTATEALYDKLQSTFCGATI